MFWFRQHWRFPYFYSWRVGASSQSNEDRKLQAPMVWGAEGGLLSEVRIIAEDVKCVLDIRHVQCSLEDSAPGANQQGKRWLRASDIALTTMYVGHSWEITREVHQAKTIHGYHSCRRSLWEEIQLQVKNIGGEHHPGSVWGCQKSRGPQQFLSMGCDAGDTRPGMWLSLIHILYVSFTCDFLVRRLYRKYSPKFEGNCLQSHSMIAQVGYRQVYGRIGKRSWNAWRTYPDGRFHPQHSSLPWWTKY